jgi:hypothetical protein
MSVNIKDYENYDRFDKDHERLVRVAKEADALMSNLESPPDVKVYIEEGRAETKLLLKSTAAVLSAAGMRELPGGITHEGSVGSHVQNTCIKWELSL